MTVSLIAAVSEDGFIAQGADQRSTVWTSKEDTQFFVDHIKQADALVIGNKTFKTMKRFPRDSSWWVYTAQPENFENPRPEIMEAVGCNQPPAELIEELKESGFKHVVICGGASIYTQFVESGQVDKIFLTVEPVRFGEGIPLFAKGVDANFQLKDTKKLSEKSIVYEYYVVRE